MKRKGIILAGGNGTRLHPITISVSKQLMPVYDKPMIYYPLSVLMKMGIDEILVITTPHDSAAFQKLLEDGSKWNMSLSYMVQANPDGLAQALILAEEFLGDHPSVLILGDNLFFGEGFDSIAMKTNSCKDGATIFGYPVHNPEDYGVVGFDKNRNVISLKEKPNFPASNYAITGLYFYDNRASMFARKICPSARGELEITDLNRTYMDCGDLNVELLGRSTTWLDTGTHRALLRAANFVSILEEQQGVRICCPEEIAFCNGWINVEQLRNVIEPLKKSEYGQYLLKILERENKGLKLSSNMQ
ncbi:MAG: glucose-1-phosphate thymidylyltransferase RfbA [Robiginitomaculum sp.]